MVVYKSEHCYENWTTGGYNNTVYDCTTNEWFYLCTFETWFFKQFIPSIRKHQGKQVVLIGDNLGFHFSPKVINAYVENKITFICLPPNTTHLCQPLNVACFSLCKNRAETRFRHLETRVKKKGQSSKRSTSLNASKVDAKAKTIKFNHWI